MSNYNIGQYRYSKSEEYLSTIISKTYTSLDHEYDLIEQTGAEDLKITFAFKGLQTYHLKCSLTGFGGSIPQEFTIKLKSSDNKREQIIKTFNFTSTSNYHNLEIAFTPKTDFSKLVFELKRSAEHDFTTSPRKMTFHSSQKVTLSSVTNVLKSVLGLDSIVKLGIQGSANLVTCINGEPIRLGKSGMFEIYKEDFSIYSIGFIIKSDDTKLNFIMDYCY